MYINMYVYIYMHAACYNYIYACRGLLRTLPNTYDGTFL